jgi:hypothetical protein
MLRQILRSSAQMNTCLNMAVSHCCYRLAAAALWCLQLMVALVIQPAHCLHIAAALATTFASTALVSSVSSIK